MQKVTPFLWFNGQAEQASQFYVSLLPDSRIERVNRSPADTPSGSAGMVLTVEFTLAGSRFIALNGGPMYSFTEAVSFAIACADQAEVDRLWSALSDGGVESRCGWLADPNPDRSRRAMEAMLKMQKINIAELERAADGR
jgi:predicted 3-demethylubiquinone-9 3-methyltransferase (glyoxalase superfamily)